MKTRSAEMEAPNIAAIVKARHHARVFGPPSGHSLGNTPNQSISPGIYESSESGCNLNNFYSASGTSGPILCDDVKISVDDKPHKSRSDNAPRLLRGTWSADDRRLFFQAVRMYGRNFSEITRFIRSRGHRTSIDHQTGPSSGNIELNLNSLHPGNNFVSSNSLSSALIPSNISAPCPNNISQPNVGMSTPYTSSSDLNTPCGGRTREQVRFFYQQTWHKVRRYTKFPEEVPQHVREVYAIVNYSVLRTRIKKRGDLFNSLPSRIVPTDQVVLVVISCVLECSREVLTHANHVQVKDLQIKSAVEVHTICNHHQIGIKSIKWVQKVSPTMNKALDHRLGEKLNELVHCGTTVIKHNGRRFLLRTPVCPALKQLNNISAPTHEFLLPEDVWIELVPRTQTDAWRVIEAEQNPRLRLRVDINRQLSDVIFLVENKWQLAAERMRTLLGFPAVHESPVPSVMLNLCYRQSIDGAIRIQEVARIRSGDIGLRAYLDRMDTKLPKSRMQSNVCPTEKQNAVHDDPVESPNLVNSNLSTNLTSSSLRASDLRNSEITNSLPITTSTSNAELDLRDLGKQLSIGVTREMAREIKLVTIYLALGCPDRIRFEYQFFCTKDNGSQKQSSSSYSDLLICPPLDPDGDGISNGLRRLLHLNASDYLLHRDWVSRHSIRSNTPVSTSCHSSQAILSVNNPTVATVTATQSCTSTLLPKTLTGNHFSQISELPVMVTTQQPSIVTTSISAKLPTVMMYSQPNTIQVLINGQPSIFQLNPTFSSPNPIISSLLTTNSLMRPPIASVQSPKLVLLQQPVGQKIQVPIVERQLDHERLVTSTVAISQGSYIPLLPKQSTVPIQVSVKTSTPLTSTFVSSSSIHSTSTSTVESENNSPVTSSLESLKAFNARRRTSIISQVNKRLTENSILTKELQSKPSTITPISNNLPPSYITSANPCTTKSSNSSIQLLQAIDKQTSTTIKGDEASVNNIHSKSITLSTPSNSNNLWSSIKVSNNEPIITTSIVFNDHLPQVHSISSLLSSPNLSSVQSNNVMSFISLSKNSSNTDVNMDDLLLVSTETNQCSLSSSFSNDTLASLLNTLCPRYPLSSTHDNQNILTESSTRPTDSTPSPLIGLSTPDLHKTTFSTPTNNDVHVSLKIEENAKKSFDFRTIDSVCSYPPGSPSIGDISFTDSMAAAVMDVHHMELDHSDGEQSTDAQSESLNLISSNLIIQPDIYPIRPSYESLVEHQDIKTNGISTSEYNCITNVEVFLRMNTPQSSRNSVDLNSTLKTSTTLSN
ncbi:unnamed protein product [Schistosoma rodhaini]|uniref:Myb-like domain-containing protein n=1 Tax=Schistosoma rodhaini TaxID=6188 RepID=A0AA85FVL2_9TREM|nr:unnamed protein product [Schistosoma rodhaini]